MGQQGNSQASAPPQQQHFPHQGLNGGWQSDSDYQERRRMIAKIVHLLQQRKPNAPQEWLKKLPQMAKRLEESLYRSAKSFEEYNDATTLKTRLQQLAVNIGMKTKKMQQQQAMLHQRHAQQQQQAIRQSSVASQPGQVPHQPQPPHQPATALPQAMPAAQSGGQRMVNLSDINPIMAQPVPAPPPPAAPLPAPAAAPLAIPGFRSLSATSTAPTARVQSTSSVGAPVPGLGPAGSTNGGRQVSDRQQVLRHQQQRLLLLRHAAKCQHEDGRCPVTPHCAGMKRLWKHIAECKNQKCLVPHCVSSRYVLSHYHRCKDVRCPVCGPVREAIHRSHEKQKQMQALKQRYQQAGGQPNSQMPAVASTTSTGTAGAVPQQAAMSTSLEPPNKRQRTSAPQPPSFQVSQRGLQQPAAARSATLPAATPSQPLTQPVVAPRAPGIAFAGGQVITPKYTGPKPQEDHTLINCFSVEQIETHMKSLSNGLQLSPQRLKTKCLEVLRVLQSHQHAWVFNAPVDPVELGLPDYFEVIKKPMDLGSIRKKLDNGVYHSIEEFKRNTELTFDNAMLYNPEGSVVYNMANEMKVKFGSDYEKLLAQLEIEEDVKRRNGEACLLCGCEKLLFEPPVFYCNGPSCPSKRIRRNSYYYVGGNNQYHWCHQCFQELRDNSTLDLGDITVKKENLIKKKNDEVHEESWVQCDRCERWVHQICALFNTRQNKDQRSEYACPSCTVAERKKKGTTEATSSTPMAEDLTRTKLSEQLENHVREKVDAFLETKAQEKCSVEGITIEEARKKVEMGGAVTIRQVTSMDRKLEVRDRMKKRYAYKNYPDEFSFRCKCIVVFQNLDGVDVVLFGLYVYEHDENTPAPNTRAVYVSYLDSVHYMRPRQMRTFIYHEILISYLDYVRRRGFSTAHIWACPPLKGDDYILYAKPEDQKTPKDDRLRQWYIDMLMECQRRGIVGKVTNMYDQYFANGKNDATVVPYMDGDYFPAEAENIIKDLEEGKSGKKSGAEGKKKEKKAKQKKKSGRGGTRSAGLDEESLKASGLVPAGTDQASLQQGARDYVMVKLGETIQPMKESFIVAFLAWEGASEEDMEVPVKVQKYREEYGFTWKLPKSEKAATPSTEEEKPSVTGDANASESEKTESKPEGDPMQVDSKEGETKSSTEQEGEQVPSSGEQTAVPVSEGIKTEAVSEPKLSNGASDEKPEIVPQPVTSGDAPDAEKPDAAGGTKGGDTAENAEEQKKIAATMAIREGKFAAMAARKRGRETVATPASEKKDDKKKDDKKKESAMIYVKDNKGRMVKVLDDDEEELDCEFLNNRQAFLNLCQGNHYQFDYVRRAKHTSMMVLWHLHNRDAPKFVQQCATCSREILSGYRYHCPTCADFDQCQECVSNPNIARHQHQLKPVPVAGAQTELTEAQRKERQRSIQLHMTLLLHASTCNAPKCPSANCAKMKGLLKHGNECRIKGTGGCNVCKRIWALLQIHARQCKAKACHVPNCMALRERVRQLKLQQQAMDDRRRQEMNRAYRGKR
jgi:E1A/CREB-binding protein